MILKVQIFIKFSNKNHNNMQLLLRVFVWHKLKTAQKNYIYSVERSSDLATRPQIEFPLSIR